MKKIFRKCNLPNKGFLFLLLISLMFLEAGLESILISREVQAAPNWQIPIYTPTPGPDGRIIWVVKANDTLLSISLISGIPVEEIRAMNNLTSDTIFEGQQIMLGLAGPLEITVTPGPTPTATPLLPTVTPKPGFGNLCIILFEDRNGDSIRQEDEPSIPEGAISVSDNAGVFSETITSGVGLEHQCFENLAEGDYTISVAVPEGYNPTTESSFELELRAGDETFVNFGAQANAQTQAESQVVPAPEGGRSPVLGIIGALFLLAGLVAAFFAARTLKG